MERKTDIWRPGRIEEVAFKNLTLHFDNRGYFAEIFRIDEGCPMKRISQISVSETGLGVIKAMHKHKIQDDLWYFVQGYAWVKLVDARSDSSTFGETEDYFMGGKKEMGLFIPHGVAHGYKALGDKPVKICYATSHAYNPEDPDEYNMPFNEIVLSASKTVELDWIIKNR